MRVFFAVGLLMLISAQVNSSPATLDKADKTFEEEFDKIIEKLTNEITVSQNYGAEHPAVEQSELLQCYQQSILQLHMLNKTSVDDFFHCDRLKEGFQKIGEILLDSFKISGEVLKTLLQRLGSCIGKDPVSEALCLTQGIIDFFTDIKKLVPEFQKYAQEINQLAKDVREIFNYCAHYKDKEFNERLADIFKQTDMCY
ncbi:uncharacterized protein [Rhodnius prolixus]|uniref:Uncharacterized protein n=1 Tax=Rhodnius prolixus TaxID=13249 RepID=T1HIJ5_RHOPR